MYTQLLQLASEKRTCSTNQPNIKFRSSYLLLSLGELGLRLIRFLDNIVANSGGISLRTVHYVPGLAPQIPSIIFQLTLYTTIKCKLWDLESAINFLRILCARVCQLWTPIVSIGFSNDNVGIFKCSKCDILGMIERNMISRNGCSIQAEMSQISNDAATFAEKLTSTSSLTPSKTVAVFSAISLAFSVMPPVELGESVDMSGCKLKRSKVSSHIQDV